MNEVIKIALRSDASNFERGFGAAQAAVNGFNKAVGLAQSEIRKVDDAVKGIGKRAAAFAASNAAIIASSTKIASSFEKEMRQVNSILYETEAGFKNLGDDILKLSREIPKSANDLAGAMYQIASSGFDGADGLEILEASGVAAVAGMTSTATAAKAVSGALNTWQLDASEAEDVADILFKTVESGVVTFEELALQMSDYTGIAQASGLALDEVSAAMAALTLSGMPASRAATALSGVLNKLIKPTDTMKETVSGLGHESALSMVQTLGLKDTLLALGDAVDGDVTAMSKMFEDVEGLRGALALTANDGKLFSDALSDIADESNRAGASQRAYAEMSKSLDAALEQFQNSVTSLRIELGQYYLPIMNTITGVTTGFVNTLADAASPFKAVAAVLLGLGTVVGALGGLLLMNKVRTKLFQMAMAEAMKTSVGFRVVTQLGIQSSKGFSGALIDATRRAGIFGKAVTITSSGLVAMGHRLDKAGVKVMSFSQQATELNMTLGFSRSRFAGVGLSAGVLTSKLGTLGAKMMQLGTRSQRTGNQITALAARMRLVSRAGQAMGATVSFLHARMGQLMSGGFMLMEMMSSWGSTAGQAREEIKSLADEINQKYDTNSLEGMRTAYEDLYKEAQRLNEEANLGDDWTEVKGGLELISPFHDNNVQKDYESVIAISDQLLESEAAFQRAEGLVNRVGEAMGLSTGEVERLATALGYDLSEGTNASVKELQALGEVRTAAELRDIANESDDVGIKMAAAALAAEEGTWEMSNLGEQLKQLKSPIDDIIDKTMELTDAQKNLASGASAIGSFQSALTASLQAERDEAQRLADEEIGILQDRSEGVIDAAEEAAEGEREALERASDERIRAKEDEVDKLKEGSDTRKAAQDDLEELRRREQDALKGHSKAQQDEMEALRDSEAAILEEQSDNLKAKVEEQKTSLAEATAALIGANWKMAAWQQDLVTVAGRTNKDVSGYLAAMGEDGVDLVHQMATGTDDEVKAMAAAITDNMKLASDETAVEVDAGMSIAEAAAKDGAQATRAAILDELGLLPGDATDVFAKFGAAIEAGLNAVIVGAGGAPLDFDFDVKPNTDRNSQNVGGNMHVMARGGIISGAQITRTPTVLHGERSTGGEAFIPLGRAHRERSMKIWEATGKELGVIGMASGGILPGNTYSSVTNGPTTVSKKSETVFTGNMYLSDPRAAIKYAERKKRQASLVGKG